jgi:isoprenylcysteine carboxyl methyltransferase (ICMT) family protein YpbQ
MSGGPTAEKEPTQKIIMLFTSLAFAGLLIVPALDHRFAWSHMPSYVALVGDVAFGFIAIFLVLKENTFSSATIELAPDQKVISTGPYAIVRHPMYAGATVLLFGVPIALGSWWGSHLGPPLAEWLFTVPTDPASMTTAGPVNSDNQSGKRARKVLTHRNRSSASTHRCRSSAVSDLRFPDNNASPADRNFVQKVAMQSL